jgi:hypothetical protein
MVEQDHSSVDMKPESQAGTTVFHSSVLSNFLFLYPAGFLGFLGLVITQDGLDDVGSATCFGLVVSLPLALLVSWILSRCFPDIVSREGIYGHSFWGIRRFVRWQDIGKVRGLRLFHLRFLKLYSSADQRVTWIGLFQARAQDFRHEIQSVAPSDSPIRKFIV